MFIGEIIPRTDRCALCYKNKPRMVMTFTSLKDEDGNITNGYELTPTPIDKAACRDCWKKMGAYITGQLIKPTKPTNKRSLFITLLMKEPGKSIPTHKLAEIIYGKRDTYSLVNVSKLAQGCRRIGYVIENNWGEGYKLVSEPEVPLEV